MREVAAKAERPVRKPAVPAPRPPVVKPAHRIDAPGALTSVGLPALELLSSSESAGHGYRTVEGEVKNLSDRSLAGVEVLVTWYDLRGEWVGGDEALVESNPLPAGGTTRFRVITRAHPAMASYALSFKPIVGEVLLTRGAVPSPSA